MSNAANDNHLFDHKMPFGEFYSNQQTKTFCYVSIHLRSHINNSSSCFTGISNIQVKHSLSLFIYYI
jgi:hypothetical protein